MTDLNGEVRFPDGNPNGFQAAAVRRLSSVLTDNGVDHEAFRFNSGSFWTSFFLNGKEHTLAVYPDALNIVAGDLLYENYLRREFQSSEVLLESFARRLTRLVREGVWELPEENRRSAIKRLVSSVFRRRRT